MYRARMMGCTYDLRHIVGVLPNSAATSRTTIVAFFRASRSDDGLPMLIEQGALAFERWFGVAPDREEMWRAVRK